jgi:hypothetical protein
MTARELQPLVTVLVAASPPGAAAGGARLIDTIDFSDMNAYASSWEAVSVGDYPLSSQTILTDAAVTAEVRALRDRLLTGWLDGESAVRKDELFTTALTLTSDPGSALVLCYHVCQMFARGFATVPWHRVTQIDIDIGAIPDDATVLPTGDPVTVDDYTDETNFYRPVEMNAALSGEVLQVNDRDSIFYLLFDKSEEWGVRDPGDWYHFFLMASIAYYAATGRITDRNSPENFRARLIAAFVRSTIQGMQNVEQMPEVAFASMPPYDAAWRWANALSFVEGGIYGVSDDMTEAMEDVRHESGVHRKGCLYGLELAGETHHPGNLHWWVPTAGELGQDFGIYLAQYHPIDVRDIAAAEVWETPFWNALAEMGFTDPGIQGFLELLRSQGPTNGRAQCVLDGATGAVLPSHPVTGHL